MSNENKGIISTSASMVLPLARFAKRNGFDLVLDIAATSAIKGYQKYISPQKGFSCAYKKLYGRESCSQYFLTTIRYFGLVQAIPLFNRRLKECKAASISLRNRRKKQSFCDSSYLDCVDVCEPDCDLMNCEPDCDLPTCDCDFG